MKPVLFALLVFGLLGAAVVDVGGGTGSHQVVVQTGETTTIVNVSDESPSIGFVNEEGDRIVAQNGGGMPSIVQPAQAVEISPSSVVANGKPVPAQEKVAVQTANTNMVVVQEQNRVLVSDSVASAEVKTELKYQKQALVSTESNREIKIAPATAVEAIPTTAKIRAIELTDDGTVPIYEVSAVSSGRMFFVIPVEVETAYKIDATSGEVVSEEKPWWSFLVWS